MNWLMRFVLLFFLLAVFACSQIIQPDPVIVFRNSESVPMVCFIDQQEIGTALAGQDLKTQISGGDHTFLSIGFSNAVPPLPILWGPVQRNVNSGDFLIFLL